MEKHYPFLTKITTLGINGDDMFKMYNTPWHLGKGVDYCTQLPVEDLRKFFQSCKFDANVK